MADEDGTVAEIEARLQDADPAELDRLALDERVTVQRAVEAERARREATGDDEGIRRAQANTGRPPAEEVSKAHYDRVYAHQADTAANSDPEILVDGERAARVVVPLGGTALDLSDEGGGS